MLVCSEGGDAYTWPAAAVCRSILYAASRPLLTDSRLARQPSALSRLPPFDAGEHSTEPAIQQSATAHYCIRAPARRQHHAHRARADSARGH